MTAPRFAAALIMVTSLACREAPEGEGTGDPTLLTRDLPFVYPPALYAARVEGDVGLRLYIDSLGLVVQESTSVVEPSGHAEFDSAAVRGAPYLEFQPASAGKSRIGKTVVLPVKFRLPAADSTRRDTSTTKR